MRREEKTGQNNKKNRQLNQEIVRNNQYD